VACQHLLSLPVDVHGRALPKRPKDLSRDIQQLAIRLLEENAVRHYEILSMELIGNALAMLADLKSLFKDKRYWPTRNSNTGWPQTWKTWNTQGFLWTCKTQGILSEFCATSGRNCNKQSIFSSSFKYLCKTAVDWVNRIIMTLDEGHYYIYFLLR